MEFYVVLYAMILIAVVVAFVSGHLNEPRLLLVTVVLFAFILAWILQFGNPTQVNDYYLSCEIVAENETSTYFGTIDSDFQEIYAVETGNHKWPDDVPYLLYMDGKGTNDITDDEVLVVWRTD